MAGGQDVADETRLIGEGFSTTVRSERTEFLLLEKSSLGNLHMSVSAGLHEHVDGTLRFWFLLAMVIGYASVIE